MLTLEMFTITVPKLGHTSLIFDGSWLKVKNTWVVLFCP